MNRKERRALARQNRKNRGPSDDFELLAEVDWLFYTHLGVPELDDALPYIHELHQRGEYDERYEHAVTEAALELVPTLASRGVPPEDAREFVDMMLVAANEAAHSTVIMPARAGWYDSAMPTVDLGHKLAASLMVTTIGESILDELQLPFPGGLRVRVPTGLVTAMSMDGQRKCNIASAFVGKSRISNRKRAYVFGAQAPESNTELFGDYRTLKELYSSDKLVEENRLGPFDTHLDDHDARASLLLRRLVLNACLMLTMGGKVKEARGRPVNHSNRRQGPPMQRRYTLTTPVRHDFRQAVAEYVERKGRSINVQSMVTGHWKMQPCGPKLAERKRIFVEPYWRGPEDAPIALRPHKL
jgi:hypothetical protein